MCIGLQVEQWPNDFEQEVILDHIQSASNCWPEMSLMKTLKKKKDISNGLKIQKFLIDKFR